MVQVPRGSQRVGARRGDNAGADPVLCPHAPLTHPSTLHATGVPHVR